MLNCSAQFDCKKRIFSFPIIPWNLARWNILLSVVFITIDRKKREYKSVSIENSPALCRLSMIYSRNVLTAHKQLQTRLVSGDPFARNGRAIKTAKWPQRCDLIKELAVLTTAWQEGGDVEYAWCPKNDVPILKLSGNFGREFQNFKSNNLIWIQWSA